MSNTLKFGNGQWATKESSVLAYNDENGNFKPLPFNFERSTSATRVNKQGLIEVVSNNEPRIDFKDSSKGSLLLEPSRTNLWDDSEGTITMQTPQGSFGVFSITNTFITKSTIDLSNQDRNFSFLVKKSGGGLPTLTASGGSGDLVVYISGNTVEGTNGTLTDLGDDWYLYNYQGNTNSTNVTYRIENKSGTTIYVTKIQLEQGSYPTSYIPTSGSTATRNAETSSKANISNLINSSEGVLYFETKGFIDVPTFSRYIQLSKNGETGFNNSLIIQHRNNGFLRIYANGTGTSDVHFNIDIDFTQNHKIAVLYKLNGYKLFIDGVSQPMYLTPTQTVFSGLDTLSFDYRGTYEWNGSIKDVRVYNKALTDQELQQLTS